MSHGLYLVATTIYTYVCTYIYKCVCIYIYDTLMSFTQEDILAQTKPTLPRLALHFPTIQLRYSSTNRNRVVLASTPFLHMKTLVRAL